MIERIWLYTRRLLMTGGVVFGLLWLACFTPYPYRLYMWLAMPNAVLDVEPEWIMVLGGGGIPSESGLMRTFYAAQVAHEFPDATIVIALPGDPNRDGSLWRMRNELEIRGVSRDRVRFEPKGANTRSQAVEWARQAGPDVLKQPLLIVTSPEHMRRSVRSFQRAGFVQVGSSAALDTSIEGDLGLTETKLDSPLVVRQIEDSLFVRYEFWHAVNYLTRSSRELIALSYYRLKGWI